MSTSQPNDREHEAEQPAKTQRMTLNQRTYHSIVDKRIADAQAEGAFDNLPGAGKPFAFDDDSMVPEDERVGYRVLKNSGFAPAWIELQKSIYAEKSMLDSWLKHAITRWPRVNAREHERMRTEHKRRVGEINRLIFNYTLTAPRAASQFSLLDEAQEVARLG